MLIDWPKNSGRWGLTRMNNSFSTCLRATRLAPSTYGIRWLVGFLLFLAFAGPVAATTDPWTVDEQQVAADIQAHPSPRQIVVVFDISGSMQSKVPETGNTLSRWQEARSATNQVLSSTLQPGDSLTILPFDSVVHKPIVLGQLNATQIANIGQQIPDALSGESGTNMRLSHDEALHLLRQQYVSALVGKRPWQAIIVVSDGYNDSPPKGTPAWKEYAEFCNVHGDNQNRYPSTPQCTEWRTLASQFERSGEGKTYGLGVKVKDAVPEYRQPNEVSTLTAPGDDEAATTITGTVYNGDQPAGAAQIEALDGQGNEVNAASSAPDGTFTLKGLTPGTYTISASQAGSSAQISGIKTGNDPMTLHMTHSLLWLWVLLVVLVIAAVTATAAIAKSRRAAKVRVQLKDSNGRNRTYWLGGGTKISIGGKEAPGVFPIEAFGGPVAYLRHTSSGYSIVAEKGIEVEAAGKKFSGSGPVLENNTVRVQDGSGNFGTFEFHDISTRTRTAASRVTGGPNGAGGASSAGGGTSDPYSKLDASLKG